MKFKEYNIMDAAGIQVETVSFPTRKSAQNKLDLVTAGTDLKLVVVGIAENDSVHKIQVLCDLCESADGIEKEATVTRNTTDHYCDACAAFLDQPENVPE